LSDIAKKYGTSIAEIMKANPEIKDANKISVNQEIKLPTKPVEVVRDNMVADLNNGASSQADATQNNVTFNNGNYSPLEKGSDPFSASSDTANSEADKDEGILSSLLAKFGLNKGDSSNPEGNSLMAKVTSTEGDNPVDMVMLKKPQHVTQDEIMNVKKHSYFDEKDPIRQKKMNKFVDEFYNHHYKGQAEYDATGKMVDAGKAPSIRESFHDPKTKEGLTIENAIRAVGKSMAQQVGIDIPETKVVKNMQKSICH